MSIDSHTQLEALFQKHGYDDFKWINPKQIVVAQWVRIKCAYGCPNYGKHAACPPNTPPVSECRQFFSEYDRAVIFHLQKQFDGPQDHHPWSRQVNVALSKLEREVFMAGYRKALMLLIDPCSLCEECAARREDCKNPKMMRPSPEGMAVDVYTTVEQYGFPIHVLNDYAQVMNRYAFLLVD